MEFNRGFLFFFFSRGPHNKQKKKDCLEPPYVVGYEKRDLIVYFPNLHIETFISLERQQL